MKKDRLVYLIIIFMVIILGIISRKISLIPFVIGDLLYAVMIYFVIRFLAVDSNKMKSAGIALLVCYCIELLQLYKAEWMTELRRTLFGRYILGQGFLWSDIAAYSLGVVAAYYTELIMMKKKS